MTGSASSSHSTEDKGTERKAARRRKPRVAAATPESTTFGPIKLCDLLVDRIAGRYRWCKELGWLRYNGAKWATDGEETILNEVVDTVRAYTADRMALRGGMLTSEDCRELATFSTGSTQGHAVKLARGREGILTTYTEFDPLPAPGKPWIVPAENGRTIELYADGRKTVRDSRPGDMNTKTVCAFDPDARAPKTEAAFAMYQPDEAVRRFLLQYWARGLSGLGAEKFLVHLGTSGGNGKGTMHEVLGATSGDYMVTLPVQVILKGRGSHVQEAYRTELASCRGARVLYTEEPDAGTSYDTGMVKKITGGGDLQGRDHFKAGVTFKVKVVFGMAANNRPGWSADGGMDRRYVEIPWNYQIGGKAREDFKVGLMSEASGWLNVILSHWTGSDPIDAPVIVAKQTEAGRKESSPAWQFTQDALEEFDGSSTPDQIFQGYKEWAIHNLSSGRGIGATKLYIELGKLGYEKVKSGTMRYVGIRVRDEYTPRFQR